MRHTSFLEVALAFLLCTTVRWPEEDDEELAAAVFAADAAGVAASAFLVRRVTSPTRASRARCRSASTAAAEKLLLMRRGDPAP